MQIFQHPQSSPSSFWCLQKMLKSINTLSGTCLWLGDPVHHHHLHHHQWANLWRTLLHLMHCRSGWHRVSNANVYPCPFGIRSLRIIAMRSEDIMGKEPARLQVRDMKRMGWGVTPTHAWRGKSGKHVDNYFPCKYQLLPFVLIQNRENAHWRLILNKRTLSWEVKKGVELALHWESDVLVSAPPRGNWGKTLNLSQTQRQYSVGQEQSLTLAQTAYWLYDHE